MDNTLSEEQEILKKSARDFLTDKCPVALVRQMEQDEKGYSPQLWQDMAGLGWMGLAFPEKYGGGGFSFLDLSILLEETGRAMVPGPFFSTVAIAGLTILDSGSEEQKQRRLPGIASGKTTYSLAFHEAFMGWDASSIKMEAKAHNGGYLLSGRKLFVSHAHVVDYLLCVARTGGRAKPEDALALFMVDAKSPGIKCTTSNGLNGEKLSEVSFDQVPVTAEDILGPLNGGWPVVERLLQRAAIAKCSETVGIMDRMLEMTVDWTKNRIRWNRPIGSFQVVQHACARMFTDVNGARLSTHQAAWRLSQGLPSRRQVAIAKAWLNQASERVITTGHQLHGAMSLTMDFDMQLYSRRVKAAQTAYGDTDYYQRIIAEETLNKEAIPFPLEI